MQTLDDAPVVESMTATSLVGGGDSADVVTQLHENDLIQVYDVSEQKAKAVTVKNLAAALGIGL